MLVEFEWRESRSRAFLGAPFRSWGEREAPLRPMTCPRPTRVLRIP